MHVWSHASGPTRDKNAWDESMSAETPDARSPLSEPRG